MHELPSWLQFIPLPSSLVQYAYRFITAMLATYILFIVSPKVLNSNKSINDPFIRLGVFSLGIYTTHFIIIGRIVSLFRSLGLCETLIIICSFAVALLLSYLIVLLLSKWRVSAKYFLGKI
jgi:NO-binding membrane sensor protein with MHYT domain